MKITTHRVAGWMVNTVVVAALTIVGIVVAFLVFLLILGSP